MDALTLHYSKVFFAGVQSIYDLHRDLSRVLGKRDTAGYLFRTDLDRTAGASRRVALVQSRSPGNWKALGDKVAQTEERQRVWRLEAGQRYRFFLRGNATVAKKAALHELANATKEEFRAARGKRLAIRGEAALLGWLESQGKKHGFGLVETAFPQEDAADKLIPAVRLGQAHDVEWRANGKHGQHTGADFEGLLEVVEAAKLTAAVERGIGPAKAFGYGLLSLAPA